MKSTSYNRALTGAVACFTATATAMAVPNLAKRAFEPPSDLATPLQEVWDHCESTYSDGLYGFMNYGWDQIEATQGSLNICVRWDSSTSVTAEQMTQFNDMYQKQYTKWFQYLYGYDSFPFANMSISVVGWAVRDTSLLPSSIPSGVTVYTDTDSEGIPQCAEACGRFFHTDGDYSSCPGGESAHYDQSFWLTDGFEGGAGGDWGQRIGSEYWVDAVATGVENAHILLHEMGHSFGLDDFYDWTPTGITSFIMLAGSALEITEFDGWMLRNWWYELSRYRGWQ